MLRYAIVEISGRQYKVESDKWIIVSYLGEIKSLECDKVLLLADENKLNMGSPYLKDKLTFVVELEAKKQKIRVATYKAKANTRRVKGSNVKFSKIKLESNKS